MLRSLTLLALSACTAASAFAGGMDRDVRAPHKKDTRVFVTLVNKSVTFRDVTVGGQKYTLLPHELLTVKAPIGTTVYAASSYGRTHTGDALVQLEPSLDHARISLD